MSRRLDLTLSAFLALAIAAPGTAEAQATKFNLTCTGSVRTISLGAPSDFSTPYTNVYRIDLDQGKWCEDDCTATYPIAEATETTLILQQKSVDTPREYDKLRNFISRETGLHSIMTEAGIGARRIAMFWRGQCEPSSFTGFPTPVTKF